MKRLIIKILAVAILLTASISQTQAQSSSPKKTVKAKIYLLKTGADNAKYPSGLFAVRRNIDRKSPLRSALETLTEGATAEEAEQNLASSTFGIKLVSVRIKNKTAYTRFTMPEEARFPGDNAPFIFQEAVERTALQFRGVKKVVVCLDGELDFGSEDEDAKPKPC
jgi:spore germination protein GerM